jgi:hypothetical protein
MEERVSPAHRLNFSHLNRIFGIILAVSIIGGIGTGYLLARNPEALPGPAQEVASNVTTPTAPQQDKKTFRDFAEGVVKKKDAPKNPDEYTEGTHMLIRDGALPVALTSSVVDLSQYEGKKVKVYGETQKALKEGWLMDVGLVEEQ